MCHRYGNDYFCAACDYESGFEQASARQLQLQAWPNVEIQGKALEHVCMYLCLFLQESSKFNQHTLDIVLGITI